MNQYEVERDIESQDVNDVKANAWENEFETLKQQILTSLRNENKFSVNLIRLGETSEQYYAIERRFAETLPQSRILKIEKMENAWHRKLCAKSLELMQHKMVSVNEMLLFHGTGLKNPCEIYTDEIGLDMRFSNDGMWGKAIYFAQNASYSFKYAYKNEDGTLCFFLAKVAVGDHIDLPPQKINVPPLKTCHSHNEVKKRYDAVKGYINGSNVFMIYDNGRVYLEYLITFQ